MDVSKNTIVVGILMPGEEVPVIDRIWNEEDSVRHLIGRLGDLAALRCCYEQPMRVFVKRPVSGVGVAGWPGGSVPLGWSSCRVGGGGPGAVALVLRLYLASKRACGPDSLHSSLRRGRGCSRS